MLLSFVSFYFLLATTPDSFRTSVLLCALVTGRKLRPMIVFAGHQEQLSTMS
ncbi:hypothetical protein PF005_g27468 [Phytophthora fragariae]|uniref:Uncharacterized protein n=1 Tax=Phytophthora fragariae TaxID=53985 RepID=A0A6A3VNN9_9STRA|nr:hypothetical protein PF003_g4828 [Phytophthora fragariae]KAE8921617.1 hypothetical protein PF009_g28108 [Phytophthora fragariae]KAE8970382.1 hypothetical protein PF011_g26443 [Phytophthora fragariae]KAE9068459.1 hypothetical protein PF010_g27059 [Phytophthora fragariae]KAE9069114.1 hypothetical protein PF007_g27441 [Phytophthora fragariae]